MKKLLIFCAVLLMTQSVLAVYFRVDPADATDNYVPSDWITIQLYDNGQVDAFSIDTISDGGVGGMAGEPQWIAPFSYQAPGALNYDGKLVVGVAGSITSWTEPSQTGVLYSFEYHIPNVPMSTIVSIGTFADNEYYYDPVIMYRDGSDYVGPIDGIVLHLVPEPATLALFGLGALLLRRRK